MRFGAPAGAAQTCVPCVTDPSHHASYVYAMSHTHACVLVHCVFSTKQRANLIPHPEELWRYLAVVARDKKITLLAAGGTANHLHLLLAVPPVLPLATALRELKAHSSRWLREHGHRFAWQEGYGAFSVSQAQRQAVMDYIAAQAEHHAKWSFEQEFMTLLRKSGVEYDPRFVFGKRLCRGLGFFSYPTQRCALG